jgi:hypothetical protein
MDTLDPKNFNEKKSVSWSALTFDGSLNANLTRSSDLLQLYPAWHIGLVLNKWYGYMYGIEVDVWADTGQVRSVQEEYSTLPPPEGMLTADMIDQTSVMTQTTSNLVLPVSLLVLALAVAGSAYFWMRKKELHGYGLLRRRGIKTGGILLCLLISSTVVLGAVSTVDATSRGAAIWGSRSSKALNDLNNPNSFSWRKKDGELFHQWATALNIDDFFADNGYYSMNHQGSQSTKSQILYDINCYWGAASNYDYFAVVEFDHGVGNSIITNEVHYMFESDYGTRWGNSTYFDEHIDEGIYDYEIYNVINPDKVVFAFIDACKSADYTNNQGMIQPTDNFWWITQGMLPTQPPRARGMPFAFTHRLVRENSAGFNVADHISNDGYNNPDTGRNVYIGFPKGSAALEQSIPYETNGPQYYLWVINFFQFALYWDYSVNQVLDLVSDYTWGCGDFANSPLSTGFRANWPMKDGDGNWQDNFGYGSTMSVFGNGNIHLKQYEPNYVSWPFIGGDSAGDTGQTLNFWASSISPSGHQVRYVFDWGDSTPQYWTDWIPYNPSGSTAYASHSWSSGAIYTVTVTAQSDDGTWSSPNYFTVNIENQPVYHLLTVEAYDLLTASPLHPNVSIDSVPVGTAPVTVSVLEGWHDVQVDYWVWNELLNWDDYFQYLWYDDGYNWGYGPSVPVYRDITAAAYYAP